MIFADTSLFIIQTLIAICAASGNRNRVLISAGGATPYIGYVDDPTTFEDIVDNAVCAHAPPPSIFFAFHFLYVSAEGIDGEFPDNGIEAFCI